MAKDRVDLICNVAELAGMFTGGRSLDGFLRNVVGVICRHMQASVCSIYLYDSDARELVLSATEGLPQDCVGNVRLKLGEGITGTALKELRPICEACGSRNPNFKYISGIGEERFEAFLAVPILSGISRVGALVVQHGTPGYFDSSDAKALRAIASQLAGTIENAKILLDLKGAEEEPGSGQKKREGVAGARFVKGIPGSTGSARGMATIFGEFSDQALEERIAQAGNRLGIEAFEAALAATEKHLEALQSKMNNEMEDLSAALIFNAHLLMLKDQMFAGAIGETIRSGVAAPQAVRQVVEKFVSLFANSPNPRLQEKVQDVRDLGHRLILNMLPETGEPGADYSGRVVIAGDLLPSDIIKIVAQNAKGLILTEGSFTAHAAILTRSLGLPLVMVAKEQMAHVIEGDQLIVDADQGLIHINPEKTVVDHYEELAHSRERAKAEPDLAQLPPVTQDGEAVTLLANINLLSELPVAARYRACGIGLYRSEFPYIVRSNFPSEEEQYRIYRKVLEGMPRGEVTFRTLDVGGDKILTYFSTVPEANPFLGVRAIRLSLTRRDIFEPQIRAFLRAGCGREYGIMFPMISSVDEFLEAKGVVSQCARELKNEGVEHNPAPRLGVMIEIPAAVEVVDELAALSDFLCLGTNDLVQYMLAVDRTNEHAASFYIPHHPAVLRALNKVVAASLRAGKPLSICGEMAGSERLLPFLLGIGLRRFSLDSRKIPVVRDRVRNLSLAACRETARKLLDCSRISEVEAMIPH